MGWFGGVPSLVSVGHVICVSGGGTVALVAVVTISGVPVCILCQSEVTYRWEKFTGVFVISLRHL